MEFEDVFKTWAEQNPTKVEEAISLHLQSKHQFELSDEYDDEDEDEKANTCHEEAIRFYYQLIELIMGPMYIFLTEHPEGNQLSWGEEHDIWEDLMDQIEEYIDSQK